MNKEFLNACFYRFLGLFIICYLPVSTVGVAADINNKTGAARGSNYYLSKGCSILMYPPEELWGIWKIPVQKVDIFKSLFFVPKA